MTSTDGELVSSVLSGDNAAFGQLYDRYARLARSVAFEATGNVPDAQDLTQGAFLRAHQRLATLRNREHFGPWLVGIVRLAGKQWRRSRARDRHEFVGDHACDVVDVRASSNGEFDGLHAAILELDEKERVALHLFYFEQHTAHYAKSLLGLSLSGFYRVMERAREKVRKRLCENRETKP